MIQPLSPSVTATRSRSLPRLHGIAFVGTYPPRQCGIATFTQDLRRNVLRACRGASCPVVAVSDANGPDGYPTEVIEVIQEQNLQSYIRSAERLNRSQVEAVSLQHEFGIFGGNAGRHILTFAHTLTKPLVTTFHTLLAAPSPDQRKVMEGLITASDRVVAMTERGVSFLKDIYHAPAEKVDLIPHGIHASPAESMEELKRKLGVEGRKVILTFGLLSPNKGIEHVIEALPAIVARHPTIVYLVLGTTHPNLVREHGEGYRVSLESLAKSHGVSRHVHFYNRFVELSELQDFIGASDLYVTPYLNESQIVSGTLALAFGAGKPVISTPYWHAQELLANGRGVLVPFHNSKAISEAVCQLLGDPSRMQTMAENAFALGREMLWPRVAAHYMESFSSARLHHSDDQRPAWVLPPLGALTASLPPPKADHLRRLTDSTGILQHALYSIPSRHHGYCTDDNARALILVLQWQALGESFTGLEDLPATYLGFLVHALPDHEARFRNFMNYDRTWVTDPASDDSHGRALWALGVCLGISRDRGLLLAANQLFHRSVILAPALEHPRSWAFTLLGLDAYLSRHPSDTRIAALQRLLADRLVERFAQHSRDEWHWLADDATYDNARLPQALIASGHRLGDASVVSVGLQALNWLIRVQTAPGGHFQPIGSNGFHHRHKQRALFDQQPVETCATVAACLEAFRVTDDSAWLRRAQTAFDWFLGGNDLGLLLYDPSTGGCRDALHADRINENQGAESTLSFHLARVDLQLCKNCMDSRQSLNALQEVTV